TEANRVLTRWERLFPASVSPRLDAGFGAERNVRSILADIKGIRASNMPDAKKQQTIATLQGRVTTAEQQVKATVMFVQEALTPDPNVNIVGMLRNDLVNRFDSFPRPRPGWQAHHLNQDAAFSRGKVSPPATLIDSDEGICVALRGFHRGEPHVV